MNVLCWVHMYPPEHNAGAEWMLRAMNDYLEAHGHNVRVRAAFLLPEPRAAVGRPVPKRWTPYLDDFEWADVIVTHLDETRNALEAGEATNTPVVHILHNATTLRYWKVASADLVVYNSENVKRLASWEGPGIICRPPVNVADYRIDASGGTYTTLINANQDKSGGRLHMTRLIEATPDRPYLTVLGAYGRQIPVDAPNNRVIDNTPDIRSVYAQTRVLLMPSVTETWGRCGVEAACSGIPVVANPVAGIMESLGDAAVYPEALDPAKWVDALGYLEAHYDEYSDRAYARALELEAITTADLARYESALGDVVSAGRGRLTG